MSDGVDIWSATIGAFSALVGAGLGGWVTWVAQERAAERTAKASADASVANAEAALRLARLERLDPLVDEMVTVASRFAYELENGRVEGAQELARLTGIVSTRARLLSPQLSTLVRAHWLLLDQQMRAGIPDGGPRDERQRVVDSLRATIAWAIADVGVAWLADIDGFESEKVTPTKSLMDARISRSPTGGE